MNPYVGPRAMRFREALYGRDHELVELFDTLIAERIVLLCAPSGAGKTSLIQAGLLPRLTEDFEVLGPPQKDWDTHPPILRVNQQPPPGTQLPAGSNRYLLSVMLYLEQKLPIVQSRLDELATLDFAEYLDRHEAEGRSKKNSILIFDQFEEVLTLDPTDVQAKAEFFDQVGAALRDRHRWALFAIREEFLGALQPYLRSIPTQLRTRFRLDFLSEAEAREAVQLPAAADNVTFTDTAATELINDLRRIQVQLPDGTVERRLGPYVEPVELQVVCERLWDRLPETTGEITADDVAGIGKVDTALADYYAAKVAAIAQATGVKERRLREWFDRELITARGTRGQTLKDPHETQTRGLDNRAIEALVDAHLVRSEQRLGATWLELAHDRLIEPIRKNNTAWYQATLAPLQIQADLWARSNRPDDMLLAGDSLTHGRQWAHEHPDRLTDIEKDFLDAADTAAATASRQRRQGWAIRILVAGIVATLLVGFSLVFVLKGIVRKEKNAEATRLEIQAATALSTNVGRNDIRDIIKILAAQSMNSGSEGGRSALYTATSALNTTRLIAPLPRPAQAGAYSPAGLLVSRDTEGMQVWDLSDPTRPSLAVQALPGCAGAPELSAGADAGGTVAVSPDGRIVACIGDDGSTRLWDLSDRAHPKEAQTLRTLPDMPTVAFGPDSRMLISGGDGMIRLWDVTDPAAPVPLGEPLRAEGKVHSVAVSSDGRTLAASDDQVRPIPNANVAGPPILGYRILLWDLTDRAHPHRLGETVTEHNKPVTSIVLSPDGRTLASGGDTTVRLWDIRDRAHPAQLGKALAGVAEVLSVAFSPDGKTLAAGGLDSDVRLWDVAEIWSQQLKPKSQEQLGSPGEPPECAKQDTEFTEQATVKLGGHAGSVVSVAYSRDGRNLISLSADQTLRVWNPGPALPLRAGDFLWSVAMSSDGHTLASGSNDGTIQLWDLSDPTRPEPKGTPFPPLPRDVERLEPKDRPGQVLSVALSPDGRILASGQLSNATSDSDSSVKLWDLSGPAPQLLGTPLSGDRVAFSPVGRLLVAWGSDPVVRLWDLSDPAQPKEVAKLPDSRVTSVAVSPDGRMLATGGRVIRVWDISDLAAPRISAESLPQNAAVSSVAFSPDSRFLASATIDNVVQLWRATNGVPDFSKPQGEPLQGAQISYSPQGPSLATSTYSTSNIKLWDFTSDAQPVALGPALTGHCGVVTAVAFSLDGTQLASSSSDHTVRLWPTPLSDNQAVNTLCSKLTSNVSRNQWSEWIAPSRSSWLDRLYDRIAGQSYPEDALCDHLPVPDK